ncbi:hypothetical protein TIFTF001_017781 [Ficus carica]|uniref:Uncharacterized protein n=1 Tax=Ficus carica TaxID=3494 RepID=A0AA88D7A2_FICCA|nr:hypothetical protein TIFTF001_017781 [Ficus carica]
MVRVLAKVSPWQEDRRCGKEQGRNEIVGGGVWSPRTGEVLHPSDLSFDGVLVPLELLLCGVNSDPCATESWPSNDKEIPLTIGVLSKKSLTCARFQCAEAYTRYRASIIHLSL